jgi:ABC-type phosphate transport system substrate-binding protein
MRSFTKLVATGVAAAALVTGLAAAVVPAQADPVNGSGKAVTPREIDIVGVGSDTDEYLFDQFSADYNKTIKASAPHLYSWDALNPATDAMNDPIKAKFGCAKSPRPDGSSAGILGSKGGPLALTSNLTATGGKHYCTDFARSARSRNPSTDPAKLKGGIVFVTLAKDAVTYATNGGKKGTNAPANLTTAQLNAIYNCTDTTWTSVGGTSTAVIQPFLPQTGSGLRTTFLAAIGVATPGSCVNSSVQQNEGTDPQLLNNPNALVPYSVAKYLTQVYRSNSCTGKKQKGKVLFGCDEHGDLKLNKINGTSPTVGKAAKQTINPQFSADYINTIYTVVRWASTGDNIPGYLEPLFASAHAKVKGWACTSKTALTDITSYGFLPTPFCGASS